MQAILAVWERQVIDQQDVCDVGYYSGVGGISYRSKERYDAGYFSGVGGRSYSSTRGCDAGYFSGVGETSHR